jgi:hypothetical protein
MVRASSISVLLLALAASGCSDVQGPCTQGCPDISGTYSVEDSVPTGDCPFSPYLIGPSMQLQQTDDKRRVSLQIIDPTTQVEVPLTGDVYLASSGQEIGSFRVDTRTTRMATRTGEQTLTLDVLATGSVFLRDGRRVLTATLSTTDALSGPACTTTLTVTGQAQEL